MRSVSAIVVALAMAGSLAGAAQQRSAEPVRSVRLYVFDGGVLESDPTRYRLKPEEVSRRELSIAAYLVVHPKGTLLWDTGAIADDSWTPGSRAVRRHLVMSTGQDRYVTLRSPLVAQLKAAGYAPADVTHLALSHFHWDHIANANLFAKATWLVRQAERDSLFPKITPIPPYPSNYGYLQNSKTTILSADEHDVFGDGTVVIKASIGHTPGHQVLYLKLAKTGGVVLSGDLYHCPEERSLRRLPTTEFDEAQTQRSREALESFLIQKGAQLWIQHDLAAHEKLKKAPQFYE